MNKLLLRSISGLIYMALIIGALLCGTVYFCALCMAFAAVGIVEFHKLTDAHGSESYTAIGVDLFGILILTSVPMWYLVPGSTLASMALMGIIFLCVYVLVRMSVALYDKHRTATRSVAYSILGVSYIGFGIIAVSYTHLTLPTT